jgi:aspartyl-tRNA(Asn)/glutamyl-tRNA(Gln) amidotransferase subunit C
MEVNLPLVDKLATLAKLKFDDVEKEAIRADLSKILGFMEKLDELDTTGVKPLVYISDAVNMLREDSVLQNTTREQSLQNAPDQDGVYFKIPKVINKESHE